MNKKKSLLKLAIAGSVAAAFTACSSESSPVSANALQESAALQQKYQAQIDSLNNVIAELNTTNNTPSNPVADQQIALMQHTIDSLNMVILVMGTATPTTPGATDPGATTPTTPGATDPGATTPATPASSSSAVKPTSSATAAADDGIFALELWDAAEGKAQVQTGNKKGGYWYSYTDKGDKGLSTLEWGAEVGDEYDDASMAPVIEACGGLCGNFDLKVGDNPYKPYVGFAFGYGASAKETADATKIKGICVEYTSDSEINVELGLTEAQEKKIGYANPFVAIPASASASVVDLAWGEFAQPDWVSATQKITSSAAVKELSSIKFKIAGDTDGEDGSSGSFLITKVGPMGSCE